VDTRGEGGYVIWPPSDGYGVVHEGEVARLPKWIVRRLTMALRRPRRAEYVSIGQQRVEALANFVVHSRRGEPAARALWAASQAREVVEAGKIGEREARATIARAAMAAGVDSAPCDEELARAGALEAAEDEYPRRHAHADAGRFGAEVVVAIAGYGLRQAAACRLQCRHRVEPGSGFSRSAPVRRLP
jgi:hypothetical protein